MQPWARWREPLAVVLLTALALMLVLRAFALGLAIASGNAEGLLGSLPGGDDLLVLAHRWCRAVVRHAGRSDPVDGRFGDGGCRGAGAQRRTPGRSPWRGR